MVNCRTTSADVDPDIAKQITGKYRLISSYYSLNNTSNPYESGSLTVNKLESDRVRGEVKITLNGVDNTSFSGDWQVEPSRGDTLLLKGGGCGCQYTTGKIRMLMADGTLTLTFEKLD